MRPLLGWLLAALLSCAVAAPAGAAWHEARSEHFVIYADMRADHLRKFAERLERFDKAVRHLLEIPDPPLTDSGRLTIYVLGNESAVAKLVGIRHASGFYSPRASGSLAFVPRKAGSKTDDWDLDTETIFFHEYAHHLQLQNSHLALPGWVVEGFAEFLATAKINKDGSVLIGSPPLYRAYSMFNHGALSIDEMLGGTYRRLSDQELNIIYGRGWALTHYLNFEPSRRGQLTRYLDAIQQGATALDAARAAFGDLKTLNRELDRYIRKSLTGVRIDQAVLGIRPVQIRPLTAGEAAIMSVRIRSKRGVTPTTAPAVAADARQIAAGYPNDPLVQATLAEAEHDAGNFAAAEAAADRSLAVQPTNVQALIYKGRARMELAKANPDKADWKDVRSWFIEANRADTENAEPLMLFHRSYVEAGLRPTKNAVDGLLYAVTLAPQDQGVRINAVRQLLIDGRMADAKAYFAPIAFHPHASAKWREAAEKVVEAISAGDGKAALTLIEAAPKPEE